ncbi:hypothetical protein BKA70DRAFT_1422468 [Coprinopsis sp. MPI-PUGE-AT-0042]|nr:hypothetical protein BKA70DRAFT_1422468 [Coprinopsis sp. MPI-PUGE-AT-0042]
MTLPLADGTPSTPLHRAIEAADLDAISTLLASGIDHLEVDLLGRTALHWAIMHKSPAAVKELLAHHAKCRHQGSQPPLIYTLTFEEIEEMANLESRRKLLANTTGTGR